MIPFARLHLPMALGSVAALLVACSPSSGSLGTLPPQPSTPPPSVVPGSPDVTPGPSGPPPGTSAPSDPGSTAEPGATPTPATGTTVVRVYLFMPDDRGEPGLVAVLREVPRTLAVATAAMELLLDGPTASEADAGLVSAVPRGTSLLGISIDGGVASVDLTREYASGGGTESMLGRLAQVVYTLTQFPTVDSVRFQLDGRPTSVFGGEGITLDGPVGRPDFYEQLPEIFVDRPVWGAAAGNPARVTGLTRVFEATFIVELFDARGLMLAQRVVTATCGTGCWGTFDETIGYDVRQAQWGVLRVYEGSAEDGSPINLRDYPVWLTPA